MLKWKKQLKAVVQKTVQHFIPNIEPFAVTKTILLGQSLKLITHRQDQVLGAMLRGEMPLCPHYQAELAWLKKQIRPGDFVLDAGGNMGSVSIALSMTEPKAFISTFEPDPLNYGMLQMNLTINGCRNVSAFNLALGETEGLIDFYRSPYNFGDHRSSKPKGLDLRESEFDQLPTQVSKVNASQFLEQCYPGRRLDLVKIDTQGADFEILNSVFPLLKSDAKVVIEFSPYHIESNGTSRDQVFDLLERFRTVLKIQSIPPSSYELEEMNCNELRQFYNEQCIRYDTYYDLVLLK